MSEINDNLERPDEIKLLKYPECVRTRPGLYVGGLDDASILLREVIQNALDEIAVSGGEKVVVDRNLNGFAFCADAGRGLNITWSNEKNERGEVLTQADLAASVLNSGSKFEDNKNITSGMHGQGLSILNALSEDFILLSKITESNFDKSTEAVYNCWTSAGPRSKRDLFYMIWYKEGYKYYEGAGKKVDIEKMVFGKKKEYKELPTGMSTLVLFKPSSQLYSESARKLNIPVKELQYFLLVQEKFYKRKVTIDVEGCPFTGSDFQGYQFELIKRITPEDNSVNPFVDVYVTFEVDKTLASKEYTGSVNTIVVDAGVHIAYLENCFAEAIKAEFGIKHKYLTNGLKMCVVVLAAEKVFSSQTKEKLKAITKVKQSDFAPIIKEFQKIFRKNSDYWEEYVRKLNYYADSMRHLGAAEKAQKIMDDAAGRGVYRGKSEMVDGFSDATAGPGERWDCEIFCTEGLSPAGALKAARKSTKYTAVLPLRGRVKNVVNDSASQMMNNKELFTMFKAIGLGIDVNNVTSDCQTPEEAYEKIKQRTRFGKLVIATDKQICPRV